MRPKFSAKDYNFVAKRLREHFPHDLINDDYSDYRKDQMIARSAITVLILDFARKYAEDNPNFDPIKFLDACSPDVDRFPLSELWENN